MQRSSLTRFAWLSIAAAVFTIGLKALAYLLTGSVGLLSDALESLVNLAGALMALAMLSLAARPPDEEHAYGHTKAEYFSSGVEGALITIAAISIAVAAVNRLLHPQPIEQPGLGLAVSAAASAVNLGAALVLRDAGRRYNSITLEANAKHLFADVLTSVAVLGGVALVVVTNWLWLDPVIALLVAANIARMGIPLLRRSANGLLDAGLPEADVAKVRSVLERYAGSDGIQYHALRTRQAAARSFISVHILVPGRWSVQRGHRLLERIEADIRSVIPNATVFTHLEPLEDAVSWHDQMLERSDDMIETPSG
ncbi:MAG: cation diffusion facilitator family transporter [Anaerolineae bacterium]|nr:cation diffusion facilitator family transporter [Candidatus Roseilinea sp.]MDW8449534.1 cation diffusion facilitator family transporter [Anaerolineae bacterium]